MEKSAQLVERIEDGPYITKEDFSYLVEAEKQAMDVGSTPIDKNIISSVLDHLVSFGTNPHNIETSRKTRPDNQQLVLGQTAVQLVFFQ